MGVTKFQFQHGAIKVRFFLRQNTPNPPPQKNNFFFQNKRQFLVALQ